MLDWYLVLFVFFLFSSGISTILFRMITVKRVNREIKASGQYSMSTEGTVGYSLFDIALFIVLPVKWARKVVFKWVVDPDRVKALELRSTDKILSFCFLSSLAGFTLTCLLGASYI